MTKIETKTLNPFYENSTIAFKNPVHIVPLSKIKGQGGNKISKEFYLF